ncbi:MAG TPA: PrsW family intramembrane metalloprotease [Methanomicrobia archaeon]|nr:PrsW family intramembrane metalloprotease [Methanomicrobia archaeon]
MLEIVYISVIVSVLWFLYIYQKDVFEPEPLGQIVKAVAWGAVPAVILSIILERYVFFWAGMLSAPIVEEACKGIYLYWLRKDPVLEGPMDGLVYGAAVAIGFEIVENVLYSFSAEFGIELAAVRSIAVGHILFTGFFGLMVGVAKIKAQHRMIFFGYLGAVVMHFVWNLLVTAHWISYFILVPVFIIILKLVADVAWNYELDAYISPREEMVSRASRIISERNGASTLTLAEELGIDPHRTALFMKSMGAKFDRGKKRWYLATAPSYRRPDGNKPE